MPRLTLGLYLFASLLFGSVSLHAQESHGGGDAPSAETDVEAKGGSSVAITPAQGESDIARQPEVGPVAGASPISAELRRVELPPSAAAFEKPRDKSTQWAGVPILGGNSDFGWGGGALLSATRPNPTNKHSNEWSAELAAVAMFSEQGLEPRFQDYYLKAVFDDVLGSGLRLTIRPSFTQVVGVNYYGLGNASVRGGPGLPDPNGSERSYYDYTHADGTLRFFFAHDFSHQLRLSTGMILSYVWMDVAQNSQLAQDAQNGSAEVQSELTGLGDHAFGAFVWSQEFDTRDEEVNPHRGFYQTTTLTFAPGGGPFTETWGRAMLALRGYQDFFKGRVVLAGRLLFDVLGGTPPVYELSRFDNYSNAFGGEKGVRGIEAQRYYGKVKLIANVETRVSLFKFKLIGQQTLMLTQFFDFGRLWSDFGASEELDGTGLGIKYSIGGGLRLLFEDSFVVALDAGWSPDAQPVGVYLTSGHAF